MSTGTGFIKMGQPPTSTEITKLVRTHFRAPECPPYTYKKTWAKTKNFMIQERPEDLWEEHYIRRNKNNERGYQSVLGEKYKPIGEEVVLDTSDLVLKTMSKCLDPHIWQHQHADEGKSDKKSVSLPPIGITPVKASEVDQQKEEKSDETPLELPVVNSYKEIKKYLEEGKRVIRNVSAGQSYEEYVRLKQDMSRNKQDDNGHKENNMVLMSLTNMQLGLPDVHLQEEEEEEEEESVQTSLVIKGRDHKKGIEKPSLERKRMSIMVDPFTQRRISVDPLTQSLLKGEVAARRMTLKVPNNQQFMLGIEESSSKGSIIQEESFNQLICIPSGITIKKERIRRDHLEYLEALGMVLTSINNMKTRDLKSKTPLKLETVKALRKDPVLGGNACRESVQGTHLTRWQSRSQQPKPAESSTHSGKMEQVAHMTHGIQNAHHKFKKKSLWGGVASRLTSQTPVIETWEDLVNLEDKKTTQADFSLKSKIIMKALIWTRRKALTLGVSENPSEASQPPTASPSAVVGKLKIRKDLLSAEHHRPTTHSLTTKRLPIWQLVALDKSTKGLFTEKKKKDHVDPLNIVMNNRKALSKVKSDIYQDLEGELQKIDREMLAVFKMKYREFSDISPIFAEHMSKLKISTKGTINRNIDISDVQPSRWYEELQEKTHSIIGYHDDEINQQLRKIGRYSTIDSKSIPSAKAKLCLLLMSLPAYEILTISTQKGLKFVLEVILHGESHLLEEWLKHRKMPYMIKNDCNSVTCKTKKDPD